MKIGSENLVRGYIKLDVSETSDLLPLLTLFFPILLKAAFIIEIV